MIRPSLRSAASYATTQPNSTTRWSRSSRKYQQKQRARSKVLAIPDSSVHRTKLTDWLELKAIASPAGRVGFGTLTSASAFAEDEQETNIGDENAAEERLVLCIQTEITRRLENIGDDYSFRIDANGRAMLFITPVTEAGSVYLFCLFLSQAFDNTDRKSTRLNSSHANISYAVFCLKKQQKTHIAWLTRKVLDAILRCRTAALVC